MWRIVSAAERASAGDYRSWQYGLESERGASHAVEVRLTGTALSCSGATLPEAVAASMQSRGRTAVESVLAWGRPPRLAVVTSDWITIRHRNGYYSLVGQQLPADPAKRFEALVERAKIRVPFGQGVEHIYEHRGAGRWVLRALQGGIPRLEERRMLSEVVAKLTGDQLQAALDLDPEGASELAATPLDEGEERVLRGLIEEMIDDTVEEIRIRLTRGRELSYEEVEQVLERLWVRGYAEEFRPGRWEATDLARHIRRRLLGPTARVEPVRMG